GYGRAWFAFKREFGFVHEASEQRVFNLIHQYAGIYDKRGWIFAGSHRQREVVVEIKSGGFAPWHAEQTAGYALAINDRVAISRTPARLAVYLRPDGKFSVREFDDLRDFSHFLAELSFLWLRRDRNLIQEDMGFDEIFSGDMMRAKFPTS